MKAHPETHLLLAHVDGELTDREDRDVTRHLADCADCRAALSALRATGALLSSAVRARDAAEPALWHHDGKHAAVTRPRPTGESTRKDDLPAGLAAGVPRVRHNRPEVKPRVPLPLRWAAGIVLVVGTTASAIVLSTVLTDEVEPVITETAPPAPPPDEAAVIVPPRNGRLHVALINAGAGSRVLVTPDDRADASIAVSGVTAPHFIAEDGRVDVDVRGAVAQLHLVLPRSLRGATVTLDGVTLITVRGTEVLPAQAATTGVSVDSVPPSRME